MEQPEVINRSFTAPVNNLDGLVPSPKTPTPTSIRKAWLAVTTPKTWSTVTSRIWGILSEATILIVRRTRPTVTDGVVILYRVICIPSMKWEGALVISCIALSLDPLFFYIPIIDEKNKCLAVDKKLRTIALALRLLTDIPLAVHFIAQICGAVDTDHPNLPDSDSDNFNLDSGSDSDSDSDFETKSCSQDSVKKSKARRMSWLSVIINFLAILPIPQVAIIVGFFRLRGSSGTEVFLKRTVINIFLVLQYLPRVCQIFISSQHFRMGGIWIKPSLNFLLYILASHVFAAFWYFFAIERETSCWHQVCRNTPGCEATFDCNAADSSSRNMTILDQLCPINTPNATVFDFGIYLPVLQSGNTGSVNFLTKLFYSLWWGLKNLSNFGTNLETSSYTWENCFAILICLSGLLLFIYLIGNMQKYMELATTKFLDAEKSRQSKIKAKRVQIEEWMSSCVSLNMKKRIKKYINQYNIVEKNITADVDVKYFLHDYGFAYNRIRESLLENLVQNAVKKVPMLQKMDENGLKSLCEYMKPVIYKESDSIAKETDHQLDQMIFIIQGEIESTNKLKITHPNPLEKGDYFGEEIETWASLNYMRSYYDPLPTSTGRVRCLKQVEAFALKAFDLLTFAQQNFNQSNINPAQLEKLALDRHNTLHPTLNMHPMEPWKCPEHGWVKLNVSAVWNPASKQAVMGCICRNERGVFMIAGTNGALSPFRDAFLAEASSIGWAIDFCQQHVKLKAGIGIVVESDNQDLIDCLNGPSSLATNERISKILLPILENIVSMASKDIPITYLHCNRQNNTAAQCVANHGYHAVGDPNGSVWLSVPPNWLISSLKEDSPLLYIEHDLELGRNNDFEETSPPNGVPDAEDIFTLLAEESQV